MKLNAEDKRIFPRIKLKAPLHYQVRGRPEFNDAITNDISLGGLSFYSDKYLSPSTNLMFELKILTQVFNPIGRIVWASPLAHSNTYRVGVKFLELDPIKKDQLGQFIDLQKAML